MIPFVDLPLLVEVMINLIWLVGGAFAAKKAIATAEKHYLQLAADAGRPRNRMDQEAWAGATVFAVAAWVLFPVVIAYQAVKLVVRPVWKPAKQFMKPPQQKTFETRVKRMTDQKELLMSTVRQYQDVQEWQPDDAVKASVVHQLEELIRDQREALLSMAQTDNPTGWDGDFIESMKSEVRAITQ